MALLARIYFNAVFGALGGLLGWLLFGVFGDKSPSNPNQQVLGEILGGALIGGFIGYLVVSVDAIRDAHRGNPRRSDSLFRSSLLAGTMRQLQPASSPAIPSQGNPL